ncbi:MAG: hypothetical protein PUC58_04390 [Oscillospiraceae bacterium]|nr:hypothetical protein [Oscillospiraceae bacterium]
MSKKLSGWITAAVCLLLIIALYFLAPVHPIDADDITYVSVMHMDNRIKLDDKETKELNDILADMTAKRCFAPANIREGEYTLMVDITSNDGPKHLIIMVDITTTTDDGIPKELVYNGVAYLYSSADDLIWYRIDNADQLYADIEAALQLYTN